MTKGQLEKCFCDLSERVSALENNSGGQSLALTQRQKLVGFSAGHIAENGAVLYAFNATANRTAVGRYQITFDTVHPAGTDYSLVISKQSDEPNRDQRKIQFFNKTANGFQVIITGDDNGGGADFYLDEQFTFFVTEEVTYLEDAQLV